MSGISELLIGRCSFWPEARDPESWFRALRVLSSAAKAGNATWKSPRTLGDTVLKGHLSRRGVPGLFGLDHTPPMLLGVGLLVWNEQSAAWELSNEAATLVLHWETGDHRVSMEQLAAHLLRRSVWLRLALLKLHSGEWKLRHWDQLKSSNGQIRMGETLLVGDGVDPESWLAGIEEPCLGGWWPELAAPLSVRIHASKTANPDDGLSLSPLKSPLYLLDSLGWLAGAGRLRLPPELSHDPLLASLEGAKSSAKVLLEGAVSAFADHRGVFPLEPVMLRFADSLGSFPDPAANDSAFIEWTDRLLTEAFRLGAIELFSSEPGQQRHGRGLLGDPRQKLLSWRIHEDFDAICAKASSFLNHPIQSL
jgi:hypothetical protein